MRNIFLYILNLSLHSSITAIFRKVQNKSVIKKTFNFLDALTVECLGADGDIFVFHQVLHFWKYRQNPKLRFCHVKLPFSLSKVKILLPLKEPSKYP